MLDSLPHELLTQVLRHATWVPYGIDIPDLVIRRMQGSRAREVARHYRLSLVTRRYLVRVCKIWHRLAFSFLYEWLLVSRVKHLPAIVAAVEEIGWCTKRLDIDIKQAGDETTDQYSQVGSLLLRLLQAIPNLQVLSVGRCPDRSWIEPSISHTWCPKLVFLNWIYEIDVLDPQVWVSILRSHPHLIGINPSATTSIGPLLDPLSHSLQVWSTGYTSCVPISSIFTSLHRLCINLYTPFPPPEWRNHLLTRPFPSLHTLQLNFVNYNGQIDLNLHLNTVHPLFPFLPNLRRIDLVLTVWPSTWSGYVFPPSARVLGVRVASVKPKRQVVKSFLQNLNYVVHKAHEPLRVQFLDEKTMEDVLTHKEYITRDGDVLTKWLDPNGAEYEL